MYAKVTKFKVKSGHEDEAKAMAKAVLNSFNGAKGFKIAVVYSDKETNEWNKIVVWETKKYHVSHAESISSERQEGAMSLIEPLEENEYEVIGYTTAD